MDFIEFNPDFFLDFLYFEFNMKKPLDISDEICENTKETQISPKMCDKSVQTDKIETSIIWRYFH